VALHAIKPFKYSKLSKFFEILKFHTCTESGSGSGSGSHPDDIYETQVFDPQNNPNYKVDHNFGYSEIGELVHDENEGIEEISWRVDSKISKVKKANVDDNKSLKFEYDTMGNRIAKHVYNNNSFLNAHLLKSTYYLRDASGNVMAVYELTSTPANPGNNTLGETSMKVTERHIYGSSRLGMDVQSVELIDQQGPLLDTSQFRILGLKQYEISNHLGNVLSVISDVKLAVTFTDQNNLVSIVGYKAVVISATDYSPFGVGLYDRSWSAPEYRYGFNGKEKDDEFSGDGNSYDFGARIYDGRLGRWLSVDPFSTKYPSIGTYVSMGNTPIHFSDFNGMVLRDVNGNIIFYYSGISEEVTKEGVTYKRYDGYVVADNGDWIAVSFVKLKVTDELEVTTDSKYSYNCHGYSCLDGQFVVTSSQECSNDLIQGECGLDSNQELTTQVNWNICEVRKGDIICLFDKNGVVIHSYIYEGVTASGEFGASSKNGFKPLKEETTLTEVFELYKKQKNPAVSMGFVRKNNEDEQVSADSLAKDRESIVEGTYGCVTFIIPISAVIVKEADATPK
jgi:RHS repeat-associated protein